MRVRPFDCTISRWRANKSSAARRMAHAMRRCALPRISIVDASARDECPMNARRIFSDA